MINSVIKPLSEIILIPLGLNTVVSASDACIDQKVLGSGRSSGPKTTQ